MPVRGICRLPRLRDGSRGRNPGVAGRNWSANRAWQSSGKRFRTVAARRGELLVGRHGRGLDGRRPRDEHKNGKDQGNERLAAHGGTS